MVNDADNDFDRLLAQIKQEAIMQGVEDEFYALDQHFHAGAQAQVQQLERDSDTGQ